MAGVHPAVWRLVTSPFFHVGLLHVAFNMLAFVPCGSGLERLLGTLLLAHHVLLVMLLGNAFFVAASWTLVAPPPPVSSHPQIPKKYPLSSSLVLFDGHCLLAALPLP